MANPGVDDRVDGVQLVEALAAVVGGRHVLTGGLTEGYTTDWTGRHRGGAMAVVRPGDTAEVAAIVRLCRQHGVGIVPQGGNTGLVGGGVPRDGAAASTIVMSLRRLDALGPVDVGDRAVTAGAGVTIEAVQRAAVASGLAYGVDLAARSSATVGGTIATNAGGLHVLRWGATRGQVLGVEAVLGDGSVISHLGGLRKDNTGYDLAGLLCGSEGTLGIVTAARLRLVASEPHRTVALVAFASMDAAVEAAGHWAVAVPGCGAVELFVPDGLALVCGHRGIAPPFAPDPAGEVAAYVLVEASGATDPTGALAGVVADTGGVVEVAVGRTAGERARLWEYREAHTEAINALAATEGPPHKLDVTLPHAHLAEFITTVGDVVAATSGGARTWLFGHAGDGNVHVNVTGVAPDDNAVDDAVLRLVASMGGSISAEHGIGVAKLPWLHLNRSAEERAAFAAIKDALDPDGVMNPGVLVVRPTHPAG